MVSPEEAALRAEEIVVYELPPSASTVLLVATEEVTVSDIKINAHEIRL
jgi:hypothetical protein